jgi:hypothetical protein
VGVSGSGRFLRKWNGTAWTALGNRSGPIDTTYISTILLGDTETDMGFALNTSGQPVVAIPEEPPSGATYGHLRLRTFTP